MTTNSPQLNKCPQTVRNRVLGSSICLIALLTMTARLQAQWQFGEPVPTPGIDLGRSAGESGVSVSHDGMTMYFHAFRRPGPEYPIGESYLYRTTRETPDGLWTPPEPLPVLVNQGGDHSPSISADGLTLYFVRGDAIGSAVNADIYFTTREDMNSPWRDPEPVPNVNVNGLADLAPAISPNDLELYLASDRAGSLGLDDIWVSRRASVTDPWSEPMSVVELNTSGSEWGVTLTSDGLMMVFGSSRNGSNPLRSTDFDLWSSQRDTLNSPWKAPAMLPDLINEFAAISPHLAPDGSTLYFSRTLLNTTNLDTAQRDVSIYQVAIPEPSTALLAIMGGAMIAGFRRRERASRVRNALLG